MSSLLQNSHQKPSGSSPLYPPLCSNQIRLLTIQPDKTRTADIKCELKVVRLVDPTIGNNRQADDYYYYYYYEALSWCWGDQNDRRPITINDQPFDVPVNLERALRQLRKPDERLCLWADAVCIDQSNIKEKEEQIGLMAKIYSRAGLVRVWLGMSDDDDDTREAGQVDNAHLAIELLAQGVPFKSVCHRLLEWPSKWLPSRTFFAVCEKEPRYREAGDALIAGISSIFQRDWWSRLWVVQEVILGSDVVMQIGGWTIELKTLLAAYDNFAADVAKNFKTIELGFTTFFEFVALMDNTFRPLRAAQRIFEGLSLVDQQQGPDPHPDARKNHYLVFIELLASCRTRRASDPRDKLYGLLGMAPELVGRELTPTYGTPWKEVFCKAAYQILQSSKSFMLLNLRTFESFSSELPSWVPSWNLDYQVEDLTVMSDLSLRKAQEEVFSACRNVGWDTNLLNDGVIRVKGFRLDRICYRKVKLNEAPDDFHVYNELEHVLDDLYYSYGRPGNVRGDTFEAREIVLKSVYPSGTTVAAALSRTAINDCVPCAAEATASCRVKRPNARDLVKLAAWFKGTMTPYSNSVVLWLGRGISFDSGNRDPVSKFARSVMLSRSFLATDLGYIGLTDGDEKCKEADEIWILAGGSHPVVLRPVTDKPQRYKFLTEAYVHGVMDGEAVTGNAPVLPVDNSASKTRDDINNGRSNWPVPEWSYIELE